MAVRRREGHRIRAHKPAVRHIGIAAVRSKADRAVTGAGLRAAGKTGAVADIDQARHHMLGLARAARRRAAQTVRHHHLRRNHRGLTPGPVRGGKGDGIRPHEPLRRRIAVMAVAVHRHRAVPGLARGAGRQARRVMGAVGPGIAGPQRPAGIARAGGQRIRHHDLGRRRGYHSMTIGGGKGHRVCTNEARIGHIGVALTVGAQRHRTIAGACMRAGGKTGAVGHVNGPG